jgi:hypothetical protein
MQTKWHAPPAGACLVRGKTVTGFSNVEERRRVRSWSGTGGSSPDSGSISSRKVAEAVIDALGV